MKTMKAARLLGPENIKLEELLRPKVGSKEVLCKVVRAGICGTDYAIYTGEFSFVKNGGIKFPMTMGHEWAGTVAEVGSEVKYFQTGDRVVGDTCVSCGDCVKCLLGDYENCEKVRAVGTINTWDGAFAEYIVMPERHLFHLPEKVGFDAGAFAELAATALYAVKCANVQIGDTVLIQGSGALGLLAAKLSKLSGASKVFITGRKKTKLDLALNFGADIAINTTEESVAETVLRNNGGKKVDRIVETSGSIQLFKESIDIIRAGGSISTVAFYEKVIDGLEIDKFVFGNINLRGVGGSHGMFQPVLELMNSGMLDINPLISGRYDFKDINQAFADMKTKNEIRIKWLLNF